MEQLHNNYKKKIDLDFNHIFPSSSYINNNFFKIWKLIIHKTGLDTIREIDNNQIKNLVIYEIIDGTRSTLVKKQMVDHNLEAVLFTLNFIYTLQKLGVKNCYIMIHTTYNRGRGLKEFGKVLEKIAIGAPLIKKFSIKVQNSKPIIKTRPFLNKKQQTEGHDDHTGYKAINGQVMFTVFLGRRQQLVQGNENHNSGHHGEKDTKYHFVEKLKEDSVSNHSTHRF